MFIEDGSIIMPLKIDDWDYSEQYLVNLSDKQFHDLANEDDRCNILEIIDKRQDRPYKNKTEAKKDGYKPCSYCLPDEQ